MDTLEEQANTLSRCGSFYYRILTDAAKDEAEYMSHLTFCNRTNAQLRQISNAVLGGCYYKDFYRTFRFTDADIDWNGVENALQRRATVNGTPVPARYEQLTIEGAFLGKTDETHIAADSDAKAILFPDADSSITLPATQELTWDLRIDPNVMVTSIEQPDGTILYANIDFSSTFGKLTFLVNPIKLFPNMQLFARSYTGRMPNLYNYMLRLDDVYGPVDRVLYHYRHAQTPKSLYYASAQACGLAVVRQDCTIVSVAPLLNGYAYSTTDGVYDAPYPHSKLAEGTELKKDTIIGGDELYVLCGPHDQLPPSVTSISLDNILPVRGLSAPNADIAIYDSNGLYHPMYEGPAKKLEQYWTFQQAKAADTPITGLPEENAIAHVRTVVCPNRVITACINEGYMMRDMYLKLTNFLQRELLVGSVLATANLPVSIQEDAGSIDLGGDELLPAGYTQLEYLESDGSQVIQTGLLARSYNTRFKIRFNDLRTSDTPRMVVFGAYSSKPHECAYMCADDESGYLQIQMNQYGRVRKIDRNYTLDCKKSSGSVPEVIYNGQKVAFLNYQSELALTNNYQNPIALFGFTISDKATPIFIGQLFYFELYVDDVKIGHFIPCLDRAGTPCMYDLVRNTPYYNIGSGDFTYPSPESSATYSLRRPVAEYAKLTPHGVRRLYKLPDSYTGDPEQYIAENGFKRLVETEKPEEGYWEPVWRETDTELVLDWHEVDPLIEEEFTAQEEQSAPIEQ